MNKVIVIYTTSSASQSMYGNKAQYHWRFMSSSPTKNVNCRMATRLSIQEWQWQKKEREIFFLNTLN